ncbi:MAG TPA: Tm-1-like ATP-binding domain-containing protein [Pirellulales bacterium]|nr:Tm-1-like ATP-binding domain-containing protein [Pirellulales bacterium]
MFVAVIATLDTKGQEAQYMRDRLAQQGLRTRLVDVGSKGPPSVAPDVAREEIFAAAQLPDGQIPTDRGQAVAAAAQGAAAWAAKTHAAGELSGIMGLGGSAGTTIATAAMRSLPIGVPKLMVSTLASGQVRHYVGDKDILMLNSVVDLSGLNRITRQVLAAGADAMAGMIKGRARHNGVDGAQPDRPLIAATMFGVTTPCVQCAKAELERAGFEVIVFHATGAGGQAMESLIHEGIFAGVLDVTTTELADELVGGVLSAGPRRLTAAAECGVPQLVSVGATDMVNFHAPDSVPAKFSGRVFYHHNPHVTLMRTSAAEAARIGHDMGKKLITARGPVRVLIPMRGVSAIDQVGQPFDDPHVRAALVAAMRAAAPQLDVVEFDYHINDPAFALAAAQQLIGLINQGQTVAR